MWRVSPLKQDTETLLSLTLLSDFWKRCVNTHCFLFFFFACLYKHGCAFCYRTSHRAKWTMWHMYQRERIWTAQKMGKRLTLHGIWLRKNVLKQIFTEIRIFISENQDIYHEVHWEVLWELYPLPYIMINTKKMC